MPAIFRVPSFVDPALDRRLAALGYGREGETLTLHGVAAAIVAEPAPQVEIHPAPTPEWMAAMGRLQGYSLAQVETYRGIVTSVAVPAAFAAFRLDGDYAALAFGVVVDDIHIFESVITAPAYRQRGYGRRALAALNHWALGRGAQQFCVQVEATNSPAVPLYRSLGLRDEIYRYHYRRAP